MRMSIRTTLTLDDDVVRILKTAMRRTGRSWKETVNEALRAGAIPLRKDRRSVAELPTFSMGLRPGLSLDCPRELEEILDELESDEQRRK